MLSGYKTYLAAIGLAILGVSQLLDGQVDQGIQTLLAAAAAAGLRHAIRKDPPKGMPPDGAGAGTSPLPDPASPRFSRLVKAAASVAFKPGEVPRRFANYFAITLAILCFGSTVFAQDRITIQGETNYPASSLVRLRATNADPKAGLLWRVNPSASVQKATNPRGVFEFAAAPGVYDIELLAISTVDGAIHVDESRVRITIAGCAPVPPAPIPPSPNPPGGQGGRLDPPKALCRIRFGKAGCTATIVGPRRADGRWDILTAAHCMPGVGQRGTMTLQDGKTIGVRVQVHQRKPDIAWMVTEDSHADLPFANLSASNPPTGTAVWHAGYGVDVPGNREDGQVSAVENQDGQLRFTLSVSSGDSGGGIFRTDTNELVSTVCCTSGMARKVAMWGGSTERVRQWRPTGTEELAPEVPEASELSCCPEIAPRQNPILWLHPASGWGEADDRDHGPLDRIYPILLLDRKVIE